MQRHQLVYAEQLASGLHVPALQIKEIEAAEAEAAATAPQSDLL